MKLKKFLLNEKTYSIQKDVDMIYNQCFKKFLKQFKSSPVGNAEIDRVIGSRHGIIKSMSTADLQTKTCKLADKVNRTLIICGVFPDGSGYRPSKGKVIRISLNWDVMKLLYRGEEANIPIDMKKAFNNELSETRIKATIWHELSHWISDTFHNRYIKKLVDIASEMKSDDFLKLHKENVNMTHFEIDALVHGIKGVKREYRKTWDSMTLEDLYFTYTSLYSIYNQIYMSHGQKVADIWQKMLVKRMDRENLLGKNMRHFIKGKLV